MAKISLAGLLALLILPLEVEVVTPLIPPVTEDGSIALENPLFPGLAADWPLFLLMIAQEVLIGVLIGFVSNLIFIAVDMAARIMSLQIGFQAANLFDPLSSAPSSALEQFFTLLVLALFLTINGHHWLIAALARSFEIAPLGSFVLTGLTLERLIFYTNETFIAGMRIALPIMGTMLLVDLGLGLVARAVPQVQVFFLGIPIKMALGFLMLTLTLSATLVLMKELSAEMVTHILMISGQ